MSGNSQLLKERIPKYLLNLGAIALAVGITFPFLDKSGFSFSGFIAYFLVSIAALLLLRVGWRSISNLGPPQWLQLAVIIAVGIRLLVGVGLFTSLPKFGYQDSKPHQTGYIYKDAYERDKDAWRFAISEAQLLSAWTDADLSDQYGGLHFISTSIYRIISIDEHRPLLIVLLTATFGSLAILFTWSSSKRMFGDRVSTVAVWIVALYPEAVLLSASQMREPFLITALALGLDGYSQIRAEKFRAGVIRSLVAVLIALVLSPPFSLVLIGILAFAWLSEGRAQGRQRIWATISVILLGAAGIVLTIKGWSSIPGSPKGNLLELVSWWLSSGAEYQLFLLTEGSGWVQKIFELAPEWSHMPLATLYGVVQPFLPAALLDSSSVTLIRVVVSLRALGWFISLPFLLFAPILVLKRPKKLDLVGYLMLVLWIAVVFVSYRDAGRMWDNPRWRAIFISIQAIVIAWTFLTANEKRDPWLRRIALIVGFATLAFIQWEAGRYYQLPRLNLWETLSLIGGFTIIFTIGSFIYDRRRKHLLE
jgi:hypothetical protein